MDAQTVEIIGRNYLLNQLLQAGLEVATPERDRGIDVIAYVDLPEKKDGFQAIPIQLKALRNFRFGIDSKYAKFPNMLIVHICHLDDPKKTVVYALTHKETEKICDAMGWGWRAKGIYSRGGENQKLNDLLAPFKVTPENWKQRFFHVLRN